MSRGLLTFRQVAERLGKSLDWFYRNRARLERDVGFPPPVPGIPHRYDPEAIDAWLDRQMPVELTPSGVVVSGPAEPDWPQELVDRLTLFPGGHGGTEP